MNVLPAKLAGVKKIVMVTPPRKGGIDPHILAGADLAGVDEIYTIGGAQAIALAYGTESIPKVDKIVEREFVRRSSETRSIRNSKYRYDCWSSEIVVVADETGNAKYIARIYYRKQSMMRERRRFVLQRIWN